MHPPRLRGLLGRREFLVAKIFTTPFTPLLFSCTSLHCLFDPPLGLCKITRLEKRSEQKDLAEAVLPSSKALLGVWVRAVVNRCSTLPSRAAGNLLWRSWLLYFSERVLLYNVTLTNLARKQAVPQSHLHRSACRVCSKGCGGCTGRDDGTIKLQPCQCLLYSAFALRSICLPHSKTGRDTSRQLNQSKAVVDEHLPCKFRAHHLESEKCLPTYRTGFLAPF